jgi:hypothetical protein
MEAPRIWPPGTPDAAHAGAIWPEIFATDRRIVCALSPRMEAGQRFIFGTALPDPTQFHEIATIYFALFSRDLPPYIAAHATREWKHRIPVDKCDATALMLHNIVRRTTIAETNPHSQTWATEDFRSETSLAGRRGRGEQPPREIRSCFSRRDRRGFFVFYPDGRLGRNLR